MHAGAVNPQSPISPWVQKHSSKSRWIMITLSLIIYFSLICNPDCFLQCPMFTAIGLKTTRLRSKCIHVKPDRFLHLPFLTVCGHLLSIDGHNRAIHPVWQVVGELAAHVPQAGQGLQHLLNLCVHSPAASQQLLGQSTCVAAGPHAGEHDSANSIPQLLCVTKKEGKKAFQLKMS